MTPTLTISYKRSIYISFIRDICRGEKSVHVHGVGALIHDDGAEGECRVDAREGVVVLHGLRGHRAERLQALLVLRHDAR